MLTYAQLTITQSFTVFDAILTMLEMTVIELG